MWYLLIPAAAIIGAWIYGASQVSSKNKPISQDPDPDIIPGPIVAGDFIVISIPGASSDALMKVDSLDVPNDTKKELLKATFTDFLRNPAGSLVVPRSAVRKAKPSDIARLSNASPPIVPIIPGISPAAMQAAQLQAATQQAPVNSSTPLTIAEVTKAAEDARNDAITKLVPQDTTPEALAALIALANLPTIASQKP